MGGGWPTPSEPPTPPSRGAAGTEDASRQKTWDVPRVTRKPCLSAVINVGNQQLGDVQRGRLTTAMM